MADDQKPQTMDINDLVRELSKSSTNPVAPTPPLAPSTQAPRPIPSTPKPPVSPPMAGLPATPPSPAPKPFVPPTTVRPPVVPTPTPKPEAPRPQFNVPPQSFAQSKPAPAPSSVTPPPTSGVKEYQSSIRTMSEDISNIKQGQKPAGINIPRKVEQAAPAPQPVVPKPAVPGQQFKVPSVNLGESQKTGPLAQMKDAPKPPATSEEKSQIYVPEAGSKGGNRNVLFLGIGAIALVAGFAYWFFILRAPAPEIVIETPTPTPTETPVPTPTPTLSSMFSGVVRESVSIKQTGALASFVSDTGKVVVVPGSFKILNTIDAQNASTSYGFVDLLSKLALNVPVGLVSNIGNDSAMFVYGQKESFDSKGNLLIEPTASNRIVAVAELKDSASASEVITSWENSLSNDLKVLFSLGKSNKDQTGFTNNSYRNTNIRFWNFPFADRTIDYSIVVASNGKTYFVVTNSREAIFGTIDKLKGF
ncbi:MAG: hypothetical protein UT29_C0001G0125 [Candidatus Yanofskybacteria bacterium GW2011_GWA1_39_13]|uniref:Uncharacterized protein n=1 Tax=Yanofskybacteria sp. (strain GW2011_GWA1_39_13) TaxID=1619019 RepID=A0A0G0PWX4_YANXG|nr:MAG: hypothetical protein UT29_C0001G0125 [Candidatus Yanofskybacteria bacterium GW2011_GWA1_39_13]